MPITSLRIHTSLQHLCARSTRESDQILQEQLGIGFSQFKILSTLQENAAAQQKHIAFQLGQTEASISRQVKLLQRQGLLASRVNPTNKREHITSLTVRGERLIDAAQTVLYTYQRQSLSHMSAKQQEQLLALLAKVEV